VLELVSFGTDDHSPRCSAPGRSSRIDRAGSNMIRPALMLAFVGGMAVLSAQQSEPTLEVTSVLRNTSGDTRTIYRVPPAGTVSVTNATIRMLIGYAYGLAVLVVDSVERPTSN
jgi:hypothetical protein